MKEVYLLRHGEKDQNGELTENGRQAAETMRAILPSFVRVYSSETNRAAHTAGLLSGIDPSIDSRAAYASAPIELVNAISDLANERSVSFLEAARLHGNEQVLAGIDNQAKILNAMVDATLAELAEGEKALIVSHDLTIVPAMEHRGLGSEPIEPLDGYIIVLDQGATSARRYSVD